MIGNLVRHGTAIAEAWQRRRIAEIAATLRASLGDAAVTMEDEGLSISGRGLVKRWLEDSRLRFLRDNQS